MRNALEGGETIVTTGLVLQELLQGFAGPRARRDIIDRFTALPLLSPDRQDHIAAAELRNRCRRAGVQIGTIDALLARLCVRHELTMLTTDRTRCRAFGAARMATSSIASTDVPSSGIFHRPFPALRADFATAAARVHRLVIFGV